MPTFLTKRIRLYGLIAFWCCAFMEFRWFDQRRLGTQYWEADTPLLLGGCFVLSIILAQINVLLTLDPRVLRITHPGRLLKLAPDIAVCLCGIGLVLLGPAVGLLHSILAAGALVCLYGIFVQLHWALWTSDARESGAAL